MMIEIMKQYQKKYTIVNEIFRLTEEIGNLLSKDDRVSTQLVLNMRQDEMDLADQCSSSLALLEDAMDVGRRQHLRQMLTSEEGEQLAGSWEEKKILEIYQKIQLTLNKTMEMDKRINMRIAGKDSFYYGST